MDKRKGDHRKEKLEGQIFNYLFVKEYIGNGMYLCVCRECNKETKATTTQLKNGLKKSCGCKQKELLSNAIKTHGESRTRLYRLYKGIKERCYSPTDENKRKNYFERNIQMCDEWLNDYNKFKDWAYANGYKDGLTIDRIDNNKGYSPNNCRWATKKEQSNNKRTNVNITINNITHTISEWCEINNINKNAVYKRIESYGWPLEKAVTTPTRAYNKYGPYSKQRIAEQRAINGIRWKETKIEFNGEIYNIADWARITGIQRATIAWRLKNGWNIHDALTKPSKLASKVDGV